MRPRLTPEGLDVVFAGVLFVVAEIQVAFDRASGWTAVSKFAVAGLVTASMAVRRRWPAAVGIVVQGLLALEGRFATLPAKTHVARILQKLDVRDRVQAVIYAYENGVVIPGSAS